MPVTQWNDEEDLALQGLPHLAQVIYLRCLRRYMDYRTGIVGRTRKISYQMMLETCEIIRDRGSTQHYERPTRDAIRAALAQLERAGLIAAAPKPSRFHGPVFQLLMASTDSNELNRLNEEPPRNPQGTPREEPPDGKGTGTPKQSASVTPLYIGKPGNERGTPKEPPEQNGGEPPKNPQNKTARSPLHPVSDLPDLTLPVQVELSEDEAKQVPDKAKAWAEIFVRRFRFSFHEVMAVQPMTMFRQWCVWQVTVEEAAMAVEAAENKLGGRADKPGYYRNFVAQVVQERVSNAPPSSTQPQGGHHARTKLAHKSGAGIIGQGFENAFRDESETPGHED